MRPRSLGARVCLTGALFLLGSVMAAHAQLIQFQEATGWFIVDPGKYMNALAVNKGGMLVGTGAAGYSAIITDQSIDRAFSYPIGGPLGMLGVLTDPYFGGECQLAKAWGVNSAGDIVGSSYTSYQYELATLFNGPGGLTDLNAVADTYVSGAYGINDHRIVVGWAANPGTLTNPSAGAWDPWGWNSFTLMPGVPWGDPNPSAAYAINNVGPYGIAVGHYNWNACIYDLNAWVAAPVAGVPWPGVALGITDTAEIVGAYMGGGLMKPFLATPTGTTLLAALPGCDTLAYGAAVDDCGVVRVVGTATTPTLVSRGVMWRSTTPNDVLLLDAITYGKPLGAGAIIAANGITKGAGVTHIAASIEEADGTVDGCRLTTRMPFSVAPPTRTISLGAVPPPTASFTLTISDRTAVPTPGPLPTRSPYQATGNPNTNYVFIESTNANFTVVGSVMVGGKAAIVAPLPNPVPVPLNVQVAAAAAGSSYITFDYNGELIRVLVIARGGTSAQPNGRLVARDADDSTDPPKAPPTILCGGVQSDWDFVLASPAPTVGALYVVSINSPAATLAFNDPNNVEDTTVDGSHFRFTPISPTQGLLFVYPGQAKGVLRVKASTASAAGGDAASMTVSKPPLIGGVVVATQTYKVMPWIKSVVANPTAVQAGTGTTTITVTLNNRGNRVGGKTIDWLQPPVQPAHPGLTPYPPSPAPVMGYSGSSVFNANTNPCTAVVWADIAGEPMYPMCTAPIKVVALYASMWFTPNTTFSGSAVTLTVSLSQPVGVATTFTVSRLPDTDPVGNWFVGQVINLPAGSTSATIGPVAVETVSTKQIGGFKADVGGIAIAAPTATLEINPLLPDGNGIQVGGSFVGNGPWGCNAGTFSTLNVFLAGPAPAGTQLIITPVGPVQYLDHVPIAPAYPVPAGASSASYKVTADQIAADTAYTFTVQVVTTTGAEAPRTGVYNPVTGPNFVLPWLQGVDKASVAIIGGAPPNPSPVLTYTLNAPADKVRLVAPVDAFDALPKDRTFAAPAGYPNFSSNNFYTYAWNPLTGLPVNTITFAGGATTSTLQLWGRNINGPGGGVTVRVSDGLKNVNTKVYLKRQ